MVASREPAESHGIFPSPTGGSTSNSSYGDAGDVSGGVRGRWLPPSPGVVGTTAAAVRMEAASGASRKGLGACARWRDARHCSILRALPGADDMRTIRVDRRRAATGGDGASSSVPTKKRKRLSLRFQARGASTTNDFPMGKMGRAAASHVRSHRTVR